MTNYTTFYLSIHQLRDVGVVLMFWLLWTMLLWTFMYKLLCGNTFLVLLGIYLDVELLSHKLKLKLLRTCQTTRLHSHQQCISIPISPHLYQDLLSFFYSHPIIEFLLHLCQKSIGHTCMGLFLDSLFCFIDLHFYPSIHATQSWML